MGFPEPVQLRRYAIENASGGGNKSYPLITNNYGYGNMI
jgi:hypothetical protein